MATIFMFFFVFFVLNESEYCVKDKRICQRHLLASLRMRIFTTTTIRDIVSETDLKSGCYLKAKHRYTIMHKQLEQEFFTK